MRSRAPQTAESAEILALEGLGWLAGEDGGLDRFLAAGGTDTAALKAAAGGRDTARAVLDFLLLNEDLLMDFCDSASIEPRVVHLARHRLDEAE